MKGVIFCQTAPLAVNPKRIRSVRVLVHLTRESDIDWTRRLCSLMAVPGQNGIGRSDWYATTIFYSPTQYNEMILRLIAADRRDAMRLMRVELFMGWHYYFDNMFDSKKERLP